MGRLEPSLKICPFSFFNIFLSSFTYCRERYFNPCICFNQNILNIFREIFRHQPYQSDFYSSFTENIKCLDVQSMKNIQIVSDCVLYCSVCYRRFICDSQQKHPVFILVIKFNIYHPQSQYQVAANSNRENKADSEDESDSDSSVTVLPYEQ